MGGALLLPFLSFVSEKEEGEGVDVLSIYQFINCMYCINKTARAAGVLSYG